MLKDGRYLVVEYKGENRWSNDDSREKSRPWGVVGDEKQQDLSLHYAEGEGFGGDKGKGGVKVKE